MLTQRAILIVHAAFFLDRAHALVVVTGTSSRPPRWPTCSVVELSSDLESSDCSQPYHSFDVGCAAIDALHSIGHGCALWLGSAGASTPTHYDSYGVNLVAQLSGARL